MATHTALRMKLLIHVKAQRVLFAEASKEVVDFLFSLLALPVATVVKLVGKDALVGCVRNLYASVEKLDYTYVQPGASKTALLSPAVLSSTAARTATCSLLPLPAQPKAFYRCRKGCLGHITDVSGTCCPSCGSHMTTVVKYASPASGITGRKRKVKNVPTGTAKGFVRGTVTYTVLDHLTISPMSAVSTNAVVSTVAVTHIGNLQEKIVQLGYKEGLAILKASLGSRAVLTDVFLGKKRARGQPSS